MCIVHSPCQLRSFKLSIIYFVVYPHKKNEISYFKDNKCTVLFRSQVKILTLKISVYDFLTASNDSLLINFLRRICFFFSGHAIFFVTPTTTQVFPMLFMFFCCFQDSSSNTGNNPEVLDSLQRSWVGLR